MEAEIWEHLEVFEGSSRGSKKCRFFAHISALKQGWEKTQNLEKTQKTRVFLGFLGFSLGFFKCGFFQDVS